MRTVEHCCEMIRHHREMADIAIRECLDDIERCGQIGFRPGSGAALRLEYDAKYLRQMADKLDAARERITQPEPEPIR